MSKAAPHPLVSSVGEICSVAGLRILVFVEKSHLALLNCFFDLLNLHLTEAFDLEKCLASCGMDRLQKSHFQPA